MSRHLYAEPSDAALADVPPRRMPGCRHSCCSNHSIEFRLSRARLERLLSGADLVPILARIVLYLHAVLIGWRLGGGGL